MKDPAVPPLEPENVFVCATCANDLEWSSSEATCSSCDSRFPVRGGTPRFVSDDTHASFGIQWNRFSDVQLDSKNGTTITRDRLLSQCGFPGEWFSGKKVLEVGCGAGRFTEVLLELGASVVSLDYSEAVDACLRNNALGREHKRLVAAQADVFKLPVRPEYDVVLCYGVLQHTGDPRRALESLWTKVRPGGHLLVDRYAISLRAVHPVKYALRPITKRMNSITLLSACEKVCAALVPVERRMLKLLRNYGVLGKVTTYAINRAPNAVFPVHLEVEGKIDSDLAMRWSVLDTFDQYAPRYDWPITGAGWQVELDQLPEGRITRSVTCGQGLTAVVQRVPSVAVS